MGEGVPLSRSKRIELRLCSQCGHSRLGRPDPCEHLTRAHDREHSLWAHPADAPTFATVSTFDGPNA